MLFWIFIFLLIVGIVLWIIGNNQCGLGIEITGFILTILFTIAVLTSVCVMVQNSVVANANIEKYKARYESLVYQHENDLYDNDNDVGKRELMADIEWWNSDLSYRKVIQRDFWIGIFIPNIYDQFEFIELK